MRILAITRASGAFEIAGTRQGISQGRIASRGPTPENTHPARFSTLDSGAEGGYFPMAVNRLPGKSFIIPPGC